jgi:protein-S-isoprenylcysteine O-methyltransferase Ste14
MTDERTYHLAFVILIASLFTMRLYFMINVHLAGERLLPDHQAVAREGGRGVFIVRAAVFIFLLVFLVMYMTGMKWINAFSFLLPVWLRWAGFGLGLLSVAFWTWTQIHLDT